MQAGKRTLKREIKRTKSCMSVESDDV